MKKNKKLVIPVSIPRNPFVAAAKLRSNPGSHRTSRTTERQRAARALN